MDLIRARIAPYLILAGLLSSVGYAQETLRPILGAQPPPRQRGFPGKRPSGTESWERAGYGGGIRVPDQRRSSRKEEATRRKSTADKDRRKLGDDYASVLMLSQQAIASHLDSSPEVSRQLAIARMQVLSDAEFASPDEPGPAQHSKKSANIIPLTCLIMTKCEFAGSSSGSSEVTPRLLRF